MIRSMTAFAQHEQITPWGTLCWELRSVNHRYLEIGIRLPEAFRALEPAVRETIGARLQRGKVDCQLRLRSQQQLLGELQLNETLIQQLTQVTTRIGQLLDAPATLGVHEVLHWPGVVGESEPDLEPVKQAALAGLTAAIDELITTREREGERTAGFLRQRADAIAAEVVVIRQRRPEVLAGLREKLLARLQDLDVDADPGRLEQELALIAQRLDVDEELDRLNAHLQELTTVLDRDDAVGRRLDFLMQEFNREANTLASKANDTATTRSGVELKVLIEQMREQVQNIE